MPFTATRPSVMNPSAARREAIEGMAARLACRRGGEGFHAKLREIKKKISGSDIASDPEKGIGLGRELHRAIMTAAHNRIMGDINERLENLTVLTANITKRAPVIEKASADAHLNIINALLQRDEDKAEQLMREHLREKGTAGQRRHDRDVLPRSSFMLYQIESLGKNFVHIALGKSERGRPGVLQEFCDNGVQPRGLSDSDVHQTTVGLIGRRFFPQHLHGAG